MRMLLVVVLFSAIGCAHQPVWKNQSKSRQEYLKDLTKCRASAGQSTPNGEQMHTWDMGTDRDDYFADCMKGEGYADENH